MRLMIHRSLHQIVCTTMTTPMLKPPRTKSCCSFSEYKSRLREKIEDLLDNTSVDESRLAMEVTLFADKICVDEEIVRLKSHIREMKDALNGDEAVGRKLDFLSQELNREANTILSKSSNVEIANTGIEMKTLIEKIREQIQNIE